MRMDFNNILRYDMMFNTPIRQVFPQVESRDAYMSGKELMEQGFMAQLALPESAAVFCIEEVWLFVRLAVQRGTCSLFSEGKNTSPFPSPQK